MITAASLVGFALAFVVVSAGLSLLAGLAVWAFGRRLGRAGPAAERSAAGAGLVLPPALALVMTAALVGRSALGPWLGVPDHCAGHAHHLHLHLCLFHGSAWAERHWALGLVAGAFLLLAVRMGSRLRRMTHARRLLRALEVVSEPAAAKGVRIVSSPRDFCFTAGIVDPRVFVSRTTWDRLASDQRAAVLAHEQAHIAQGDLWRRAGLGMLSALGAPVVASGLLRLWDGATERLCDRAAARLVGDRLVVASALLALVGRQQAPAAVGAAFTTGNDVVGRVEALLDGALEDGAAVRWLRRALTVTIALAAALVLLAADPLHHGLETLLGGF